MNEQYLRWLSEATPTSWWHDSAIPSEIDTAILHGATGVTTNPILSFKCLQAEPDFWRDRVGNVSKDLSGDERAEELLRIVVVHAAEKFRRVFDESNGEQGYALGQLNPAICSNTELMLEQALRYTSWAENIAVKVPTVKAVLPVIEELAARGIAVCATLNFSVSQGLAAGEAYERGAKKATSAGIKPAPCFVVQQGGRLDEYLLDVARDNRVPIGEDEIRMAGNAVCKKTYRLFKERGIRAKIMPAGLRGVHHLTEMAGAEMVFSLQKRIQNMVIDADPPRIANFTCEVDDDLLAPLLAMPEFVRAYEDKALNEDDFVTFGLVQKTLAQFFWTGWAALETYASSKESDRWF